MCKATAHGLRKKLGAQSDDDDVGPAAIAARSESGWSASGERGLSIPPALRTLISSRSRGEAEKRRGKVWDEDIKEKRAIYSPSFWAGDSQTRQWENKGTNSNFPSSNVKEFAEEKTTPTCNPPSIRARVHPKTTLRARAASLPLSLLANE